MQFIFSIFRNRPGKIVLWGWIVPATGVMATLCLYYLSGCIGGYIDTVLECTIPLYEFLLFPHAYQLFVTVYLFFTSIIYLPIFIVAIVRAVRMRASQQIKN